MISRSESAIVATATSMVATISALDGSNAMSWTYRRAVGEGQMAEIKTKPTGVAVDDFIDAVPDPQRREDGEESSAR